MALPDHVVAEYSKPQYVGINYYGMPLESMTHDELLIVARALAAQPQRPKRIPIMPVPDNSGGRFDAKSEVETLRKIVRQLTDYVNELRRDVDRLQGPGK